MYELQADNFITNLDLEPTRRKQVEKILKTIYPYKLKPYSDFVSSNPDNITNQLQRYIANCNDNWDIVMGLYRYNIKLASGIYPYIYILETALKAQIDNELSKTNFGENWYNNNEFWSFADPKNYAVPVVREYEKKCKKKSKTPCKMHFIETETMFGFWTSLLSFSPLWGDSDTGIKLKRLFDNGSEKVTTLSHKDIKKKLTSIRLLRNSIAHFNQIICDDIFKDKKARVCYRLYDIYGHILYFLNLLGCDNVDWMIGDLKCPKRNFEKFYNELDFIHGYNIQADTRVRIGA